MIERTRLENRRHRRPCPWRHVGGVVEQHRHAVGRIEPYDNRAYRRLVARLSHLITCGDTSGMVPIDTAWERPADWELDDVAG